MMEKNLVYWSDELATNIGWQDFQHYRFLEMSNALYEEFYNNKGLVEIAAAVEFLERYAMDHFALEEKYMRLFDYPDIEAHQKQHEQFKKFTEDLKSHGINNVTESARLCHKLNVWFVDHIQYTDKQLGDFLAKQNQK